MSEPIERIDRSPLVHGYLHEFMDNCRLVGCARQIGDLVIARGLCLKPFDFVELAVVADAEDHDPDEHLIATIIKSADPDENPIGSVTSVGSDGSIKSLPEQRDPGLSLEHTFLLAACLRAALPAETRDLEAVSLLANIMTFARLGR